MGRFNDGIIKRKKEGFIPVIPDFKAISPKEGDLFLGRNPVEVALMLAETGAPVFSVVTENSNFGGTIKLMEDIINATGLPVLRKDFIKTIDDLKETKYCGADAVLLICSTVTDKELEMLYYEAVCIGLEPLVEARTADELILAAKLGAKLVGINNRNILELEKDSGDVAVTKSLSCCSPKDALLISESGIFTKKDVDFALNAGADAVLVGTALWQAENMEELYNKLSMELKKGCAGYE